MFGVINEPLMLKTAENFFDVNKRFGNRTQIKCSQNRDNQNHTQKLYKGHAVLSVPLASKHTTDLTAPATKPHTFNTSYVLAHRPPPAEAARQRESRGKIQSCRIGQRGGGWLESNG